MPFGVKPVCCECSCSSSTIWRRNEKGAIVCNSCATNNDGSNGGHNNGNVEGENNGKKSDVNGQNACPAVVLRKSTRARATKNKNPSQAKSNSTKGKGRRIIFKKSATKAPTAVATPLTTDCVFYKGSYFQTGDIVSLLDVGGGVYYAQIRGLLQDQYCEKSAVITWLIPTQNSPKDRFDPSTYIIGPEEEIPRKLECMEFVCHAPSDYFREKNSPYPTLPHKPEACFIWTRLRPHIQSIKKNDDIYSNPY